MKEGYIRKYLDSDMTTKDDYIHHISTIEDIDNLRQETKKLYVQYNQQAILIKKLEFELEMEQGHTNILRHDNQTLKKTAVDMSVLSEQEEEFISNKLLKHITGLKKEKGELLIQVEQEEEWLTNMLQKKLVQVWLYCRIKSSHLCILCYLTMRSKASKGKNRSGKYFGTRARVHGKQITKTIGITSSTTNFTYSFST